MQSNQESLSTKNLQSEMSSNASSIGKTFTGPVAPSEFGNIPTVQLIRKSQATISDCLTDLTESLSIFLNNVKYIQENFNKSMNDNLASLSEELHSSCSSDQILSSSRNQTIDGGNDKTKGNRSLISRGKNAIDLNATLPISVKPQQPRVESSSYDLNITTSNGTPILGQPSSVAKVSLNSSSSTQILDQPPMVGAPSYHKDGEPIPDRLLSDSSKSSIVDKPPAVLANHSKQIMDRPSAANILFDSSIGMSTLDQPPAGEILSTLDNGQAIPDRPSTASDYTLIPDEHPAKEVEYNIPIQPIMKQPPEEGILADNNDEALILDQPPGEDILKDDVQELQSPTELRTHQNSPVMSLKDRMKLEFSKCHINVHITKCGLSGPQLSGKTNIRALLLGKSKPERRSTVLSTKADPVLGEFVSSVARKSNALKWTSLGPDSLKRLLTNTVFESLTEDERQHYAESTAEEFSEEINLCDEVYSSLCDVIKSNKGKKSSKRRTFKDVELFYLVDNAGQPQFQEILPNFVKSSVNFLVHDLTQDLESCPKFKFYFDKKIYTIPEPLKLSNLSIIEQSVLSLRSTCQTEMWKNHRPAFAILGTFKDKFDSESLKKALEDKSSEIKAKIQPYNDPEHCTFLEFSRTGNCIFPIDCSEEGWSTNEDVLLKLKGFVHEYGKKYTVDQIAMSYFIFLQELINKKKPYLTLQQCLMIAQNEYISLDRDDVEKALCLFHDVNIILYFPHTSLKNLVFIEPSFLYDRITDIIMASFSSPEMSTQLNNFHKTGIFMKDQLKLRLSDYPELTETNFLTFLEDLFIVSKLREGLYFMPCVLQLEDPKSLSKESEDELKKVKQAMQRNKVNGPLIINYNDKVSPRGLICAMVVKLSTLCGWSLNTGSQCIRRRNLIEFNVCSPLSRSKYSPLGSAVIFDRNSHLEIYTTCKKKNCMDVKNAIQLSLYEAGKSMKYGFEDIDMKFGFHCSCDTADVHFTEVSLYDNGEWLQTCQKTYRNYSELDAPEKVWFDNQQDTTKNELNMSLNEAIRELIPNTNSWESIAFELKFSAVEVERIRIDNNSEKERFTKLLVDWEKHMYRPFTWNTVISVLTSPTVGEYTLAANLKQKYNI